MVHLSLRPSFAAMTWVLCLLWKESPSLMDAAHPDLILFGQLWVSEKKPPWKVRPSSRVLGTSFSRKDVEGEKGDLHENSFLKIL